MFLAWSNQTSEKLKKAQQKCAGGR